MKRILFIAIIISQVLISTQGVLFAKSEKNLTIEQESKSETTDEPEIFERSTLKRIVLYNFYSVRSYSYSVQQNSLKVEPIKQPDFLRIPLFILQGSLRT